MKTRSSTYAAPAAAVNNQEEDDVVDITTGLDHISVQESKFPVVSFGDSMGEVASISTASELKQQLPDLCNEVFNVLGPYQLEATYQRALAFELKARGVRVESELSLSIVYKGQPIATRRLDLLLKLDKTVVLELKAVTTALKSEHLKQLHFYMDHFSASEGYLINFPHKTGFPDSEATYKQEVIQPEHGDEVSDRSTRASTPRKSTLPHVIFVQRAKSTKTVKKTVKSAKCA